MTQQPTQRVLSTSLKKRVNRLAHTAAIRHESAMRRQLLDDMQRLTACGADRQALEDHLDQVEKSHE